MRTRWSVYAGVSAALAGGVIVKALAQRPNFYSAAVYLSQSSANLMILTHFLFVASCSILLGLQKLLYGPLRPIEIEQLYEKAWFAVTETCLAMTIFRGEIGAWFLVMFFALLAGKVWAWIGEGRVEILEQQPPRNPRLFHTRLALSLSLSVLFDLTMLEYVVKQVMRMARPDMMVMFGFEFAVLSIVSLSTAARYAIDLVEIAIVRQQKARKIDEIRRDRIAAAVREVNQAAQQPTEQELPAATANAGTEAASIPLQALEAARRAMQQPIDEQEIEVEGWEAKGRWIFYLDLTTDFFKLVVYLSFFFILLIFYGLPIHILRDVFMTFRSFFKRIGDFMRYRTATRDMNARFPDATAQEVGSEDVCIICREEMRPYEPPTNGERANPVAERMRPKKLPCGHILHFSCLRSWLERQQICPTCRTNVVSRTPSRTTTNNAAGDGGAGQHANAAPADRPGPRIYQWGPLRIGIGAARGNMLEDLQQRLGDGQQQPPQQAQADGPQQYGVGIRWDGFRRRDRGDRNQRSITRQLDDVQRQITQEFRALGQMTNELRHLRNMEAELSRLRAQRTGGTASTTTVQQPATTNLPQMMALTGDPQQTIPAGSSQLPAGLTLPENWSIMPLHQTQPALQAFAAQSIPTLPIGSPPGQLPPPHGAFGIPPMHPFAGVTPGHFQTGPMHLHQHAQGNHMPNGIAGGSGLTNGFQPQAAFPPQGHMGGNQSEQNGGNLSDGLPISPSQPAQPHNDHRPAGEITSSTTPQTDQNNTTVLSNGQLDSQPTASSSGPVVNGASRQNRAPQRPSSTDGNNETPVASMFTLPSWGSTPMQTSTSNRAANDRGEYNPERNALTSASPSGVGPAAQGQNESRAGSSKGKSKNPTVEDLVEEPD